MRTQDTAIRWSRAALVLAVLLCLTGPWTPPRPPEPSTDEVSADEVSADSRAASVSLAVDAGVLRAAPRRAALATFAAPRIDHGSLPTSQPIAGPDGSEIAEGELLATCAPGREDDVEAALRASLPVRATRRLSRTSAIRVRLAEGASLADALAVARAIEGVEDATTNAILRGTDRRRRRDRARQVLWNVSAMHLRERDLSRRGRADHIVALLDSGVAFETSPGLARAEIVAPFDAIDGDTTPNDENGHGTFLANLLVGAPGLARGAALMPVRVLDEALVGTEAALIEGLAHARAEGADVVNLSLVYDARYLPTRALDAAIAETLASGMVIVAAAGNDGAAQVRYPAAFPGVIAVGASTPASSGALVRAHYSSHGAALDVLAPGGDLDADRNRDGWPDGILAESFDPEVPGVFAPWLYAGTSQAAVHASAAVLHVLADGGAPARMAAQLRETARGGEFDAQRGGGFLDATAALGRRVDVPRVGAQSFVVLRDLGRGARGVVAPVALLDGDDRPVVGAWVHGRFRGSIEATATCVTSRDGTCHLEASPLSAGPAMVALELEAVVLRNGRAVRPATLTSDLERDAALSVIDGVGFGSSSTVWIINPSLLSLSYAMRSYVIYGTGEASALAPTVIAFDDAVASTLGSSEQEFAFLPWQPASFLGGSGIAGGGFGSSSTTWSGWSFTWSGWGSSIYTSIGSFSMYGAQQARIAAE